MPALRALREPGVTARRFVRRHRRALAAVVAGLGLLVALTTLRGAPSPASGAPVMADGRAVRPGEVIVPLLLTSGALASVLSEGDIVDIVGSARGETSDLAIIASRVRVVDLPSAGSALTSSSSTVLLVAAPETRALALSAASAAGGVGVLIRGH
jgi:hypothetical protein